MAPIKELVGAYPQDFAMKTSQGRKIYVPESEKTQ
jgi:hypothetical protein